MNAHSTGRADAAGSADDSMTSAERDTVVPDLAEDTVIYIHEITNHVSLVEAMGRLNGQRSGDTGYWWEFIGPVTGYSAEWGDIRSVLSAGVRGEFGFLIWAEEADPEPHEIPVVTCATNEQETSYMRVPPEFSGERLPVPAGREIPLDDVLSAVAQFCTTGSRPNRVQWCAVNYDTAHGQGSVPEGA